MKIYKRKKSVKKQWLYSYLIILLIPTILSFGYYYYSKKTTIKEQNEFVQTNRQVLDNLKTYVDGQLDVLISFYYYLTNEANLSSVANNQLEDKQFRRNVVEMLFDLNDYQGSKELSYLIYLPERDYIIWDGIAYNSRICYDIKRLAERGKLTYQEWTDFLGMEYSSEFRSSAELNVETFGESIVYTKTKEYRGRGTANVFVSFTNEKIQEMIDILDAGVQVAIVSADEILFSTFQNDDSVFDYGHEIIEFRKQFHEVQEISNLEEYTCIQKESVKDGIMYYLFVPKAVYTQKLVQNRLFLLISLFVILLFGAGGIYILLNKNFKQVDKLLDRLGIKEKTNDVENEFEQIENILGRLKEDNKNLNDNIQNQQNQLREKKLLALMQGRVADITKDKRLLPSLCDGEQVMLAGFEIPMPESKLYHDELLWFAMDNIFAELSDGKVFHRVDDGTRLLYLFIQPQNAEEQWRIDVRQNMEYLCDFFEEKWGISLTAAISGLGEGLERASFLYQNMLDAFEYKKLIGGIGVIDIAEIKKSEETWADSTMHGTMLQIALEKGDFDEVTSAVEKLFNSIHGMSYAFAKVLVLNTYQSVLNFLFQQENIGGERTAIIRYLNVLMEAENIENLKKGFCEMIEQVYHLFEKQGKEESNGLIREIKEYIEKNYTDSNLNINSIAESFGKSSRYISKVFRDEAQEGLLDYINRLRIEKAQALLRTGKYSLEKTGEKVGYASYKTFRRSFIKSVEMTPGKYAEQFIKK